MDTQTLYDQDLLNDRYREVLVQILDPYGHEVTRWAYMSRPCDIGTRLLAEGLTEFRVPFVLPGADPRAQSMVKFSLTEQGRSA